MPIQTESNEHYELFIVDDEEINQEVLEELKGMVENLLGEAATNVIVEFPNVQQSQKEAFYLLEALATQASEAGLSFIIANPDEAMIDFASSRDISYAPTLEEGVDLVLIEQIERDMNDENAE